MSLTPELISGTLSFFFTVALLSYLIGDNPLYRLALHIFVGVAVGYAALVVIYQVLVPRLINPLTSGDATLIALASVPLFLFIFLALKLGPRTAAWGNISIAYLIGVGAAVATGGALTGTLVPQIQTTWLSLVPTDDSPLGFVDNIIIVAGTITTLLYFQFWLRGQTPSGAAGREPLIRVLAGIGQGFLVLTLGVIYGGMILSGIAILSERLSALAGWVSMLLP
jgi:hypothetical protein